MTKIPTLTNLIVAEDLGEFQKALDIQMEKGGMKDTTTSDKASHEFIQFPTESNE